MRELLNKNGKRKKKREEKKRGKLVITWLDKKRREICALCRSVSQRGWMKADKAGSKW